MRPGGEISINFHLAKLSSCIVLQYVATLSDILPIWHNFFQVELEKRLLALCESKGEDIEEVRYILNQPGVDSNTIYDQICV